MMSTETTNILICGVGGQGVLLASEVISLTALAAGLDVKKSEVHGMAQRGGSVESHVRFGERVDSPLVSKQSASVLLGFEPMETLRYLRYAAPSATVVYSTQRVVPPSIRDTEYPDDVESRLEHWCQRVIPVDTEKITRELGNPKVANVLLLGVLSVHIDLPVDAWQESIAARVPAKALKLNQEAFERGRLLGG